MEPHITDSTQDNFKNSAVSPKNTTSSIDLKDYTNNPNTQYIFSPALHAAIASDPNWDSQREYLLPDQLYDEIERTVLSNISQLRHAYHNLDHTQNVIARALELAELANLNDAETQLLGIAALFHDYDHAGNTFRQTVKTAQGNCFSNEEYAAIKADEFVGQYLSVPQRLQLQGIILATSFGQGNPAMLPDPNYQRDYKPTTKLEKLLAFADINNLKVPLSDWMDENFTLILESNDVGIPADFDQFLNSKLGFLKYVQMKLDDVQTFLTEDTVTELQEFLDQRVQDISSMLEPSTPLRRQYIAIFQNVKNHRLEELAKQN